MRPTVLFLCFLVAASALALCLDAAATGPAARKPSTSAVSPTAKRPPTARSSAPASLAAAPSSRSPAASAVSAAATPTAPARPPAVPADLAALVARTTWYGQSSLRIAAQGKIIYLDPWQLPKSEPGDLILITHDHFDHLSAPDIDALRKPGTVVLAPASVLAKLGRRGAGGVAPGQRLEAAGLVVETTPAYNIGKSYHPRDKGYVGYVITVEGKRVFVAGDTDDVPELRGLRVDIAFLPVGGIYTMTAAEAADLANQMKPRVAIPYHWGKVTGVGRRADADRFRALCQVPVVVK